MNGNQKGAIQLYQWNVGLSGAMHESLHVFEVVLRNSMDKRLCAWNATQTNSKSGSPYSADWLMDPAPLLARLVPSSDLSTAKSRAWTAVGKSRKITHADVLAQMPFSVWRFLLPDKDPGRQFLWANALSAAFPGLSRPVNQLVAAIDGIYGIRNRVAHLEPLLDVARTRTQFQNIREVTREIDPAVEQWLVSNQRVTTFLKSQPIPES